MPEITHQRRKRYSGTHPRKFAEKYKEHRPELYPEDVAKVLEAGKTPAGMHRPIMVQEVLRALAPQPGEVERMARWDMEGMRRNCWRGCNRAGCW